MTDSQDRGSYAEQESAIVQSSEKVGGTFSHQNFRACDRGADHSDDSWNQDMTNGPGMPYECSKY